MVDGGKLLAHRYLTVPTVDRNHRPDALAKRLRYRNEAGGNGGTLCRLGHPGPLEELPHFLVVDDLGVGDLARPLDRFAALYARVSHAKPAPQRRTGRSGRDDEGVRVGLHPYEALIRSSPEAPREVLEVVELLDLPELVLVVEVGDKPVLGVFEDGRGIGADLLRRVDQAELELLALLGDPVVDLW